MIEWVDDWLKLWAREVRGGLPGRSAIQLEGGEDIGREFSPAGLSADAWAMECVVQALVARQQGLVKIHYLPQHNSTRDRVQAAARFLGDKAPRIEGVVRGTAAYREQQDRILDRQQRRYYRLLDDAHGAIAGELRAIR